MDAYQRRKGMLSEAKDLENQIGTLCDEQWNRLVEIRRPQASAKASVGLP